MNTNGINTALQIGKEADWGTKIAATQSLNFLGETFTTEPELLEEDTVIGNISAGAQDLVAINTKGGFDTILKPEDAVALFALALGLQATPTLVPTKTLAYKHVITPVDASTDIPSFTAVVDRKLQCKAYIGCQISNLEVSAKSKDYVRCKATTVCRAEEVGVRDVLLLSPTKKAFIFASGSVLIDNVAFADITSMALTINPNITEGEQTLGSGLNKSQGGHGAREFTMSLETKYNSQSNTLIETKYKLGATVAVKLNFASPALIEVGVPHSIEVSLPNVMLTGGLPNISGKDDIKVTLAGKALEIGGVCPCTVTIISDIDESF
jgi:hypothetical protein